MEYVFSTEPPIIVVEVEDEEAELSLYHVFLEGENVATAYSSGEAREIAAEVFAAVTGDDEAELPE
jgi:hypothetical protein